MVSIATRLLDRIRWELREWRHPSRRSFTQEELDRALLDEITWRPGERVLDVGCGNGAYVDALRRKGATAFGIDPAEASVRRARSVGGLLSVADGRRLPFDAGRFDTILCHRTLYLVPDPLHVVHELNRVLRPGGRVVFSTSNDRSPSFLVQDWYVRATDNRRWFSGNDWVYRHWNRAFAGLGFVTGAVYSCNLTWPLVYRLGDRWLIPNEWMRRYGRWIRRVSDRPLRSSRPLAIASDYVVVLTKPEAMAEPPSSGAWTGQVMSHERRGRSPMIVDAV